MVDFLFYQKVFHSKACRRGPFFYVQVFKKVLLAIFCAKCFQRLMTETRMLLSFQELGQALSTCPTQAFSPFMMTYCAFLFNFPIVIEGVLNTCFQTNLVL